MHPIIALSLLASSWAIIPTRASDLRAVTVTSNFSAADFGSIVAADRARLRQLIKHAEEVLQEQAEQGINGLNRMASHGGRREVCTAGDQTQEECEADAPEHARLMTRSGSQATSVSGAVNNGVRSLRCAEMVAHHHS
jgi:hypothetical protein